LEKEKGKKKKHYLEVNELLNHVLVPEKTVIHLAKNYNKKMRSNKTIHFHIWLS